MFKLLISSTFFMALVFAVTAMIAATIMRYTGHMNANQWLTALATCSTLGLGVIGKRTVDGVSKAFGKNNGRNQ